MKKKLLIAATFVSSVACFAQDAAPAEETILKSKKGHEILPRKGDIALGFNTVPIIDFLLNSTRYLSLFGGTPPTANNAAGNALQYTSASSNQIVGKYFLDDNKTAIRARIGLNSVSGTVINQVQDAKALAAAQNGTQDDIDRAMLVRVDDKLKYHKKNLVLAVGYEKRRGYNRLRGVYGGEIGFGHTSANESVTYGNAFSDTYNTFYTSSFNPASSPTTSTQQWNTSSRVSRNLERDYRAVWMLGVRGFIGIEYFVFPKISIAAEYGWGFSASTQKGRTDKNEVYFNGQGGPAVVIEEVDTDSGAKSRGFSVDNNNTNFGTSIGANPNGSSSLGGGSGSITALFHF